MAEEEKKYQLVYFADSKDEVGLRRQPLGADKSSDAGEEPGQKTSSLLVILLSFL